MGINLNDVSLVTDISGAVRILTSLSAVADEHARRAASRPSGCKQRWTFSEINWRSSSVRKQSSQHLRVATIDGPWALATKTQKIIGYFQTLGQSSRRKCSYF